MIEFGVWLDLSLGLLLLLTFGLLVRLSWSIRSIRRGRADMERLFEAMGNELNRAEENFNQLRQDLGQEARRIDDQLAEARDVLRSLHVAVDKSLEAGSLLQAGTQRARLDNVQRGSRGGGPDDQADNPQRSVARSRQSQPPSLRTSDPKGAKGTTGSSRTAGGGGRGAGAGGKISGKANANDPGRPVARTNGASAGASAPFGREARRPERDTRELSVAATVARSNTPQAAEPAKRAKLKDTLRRIGQ